MLASASVVSLDFVPVVRLVPVALPVEPAVEHGEVAAGLAEVAAGLAEPVVEQAAAPLGPLEPAEPVDVVVVVVATTQPVAVVRTTFPQLFLPAKSVYRPRLLSHLPGLVVAGHCRDEGVARRDCVGDCVGPQPSLVDDSRLS